VASFDWIRSRTTKSTKFFVLKILTTGFQFFPFSKKIKKIKEAFITKIKNTLSNHNFYTIDSKGKHLDNWGGN